MDSPTIADLLADIELMCSLDALADATGDARLSGRQVKTDWRERYKQARAHVILMNFI